MGVDESNPNADPRSTLRIAFANTLRTRQSSKQTVRAVADGLKDQRDAQLMAFVWASELGDNYTMEI